MWPKTIICGLWSILLTLTLGSRPEIEDQLNVKYIQEHPGLFYEDIGRMKMIEKEWQIITTVDYTSLREKLTKGIKPQYDAVWDQCIFTFSLRDCEQYLEHDHYQTLQQEGRTMDQHLTEIIQAARKDEESRTVKRAPFLGFIRSISRSLFGTMDYNDFEHINKEIDKLYNGQNQITHLVNNATHIIRSEIDKMMDHMEISRRNIKILRNTTERLQQGLSRQASSIALIEMSMKFQHAGNELIHSAEIVRGSTGKIIEAIDASKHGRITQTFLTPKQLNQATEEIRKHRSELEFPIPKGKTDYPALSKISTIHTGHTKGKYTMLRLAGKQNTTTRYFHGGYTYHLDPRVSVTIFRCTLRNREQCRAVIYVNSLDNLANQPVMVRENHGHEPDHFLPLREKITEEVLQLALSWEDPKEIFNRAKAKGGHRPIAAGLFTIVSLSRKWLMPAEHMSHQRQPVH
nr:PREDICTED: uncharacterized protein LOC105272547 [Fopius arisanus]